MTYLPWRQKALIYLLPVDVSADHWFNYRTKPFIFPNSSCLPGQCSFKSKFNFSWLVKTRVEYSAWRGFSAYYFLVVSATAPEAILELPISCREVTEWQHYPRVTVPRQWSVCFWQWLHPCTHSLTCLSESLPMSSSIKFILLLMKWQFQGNYWIPGLSEVITPRHLQ